MRLTEIKGRERVRTAFETRFVIKHAPFAQLAHFAQLCDRGEFSCSSVERYCEARGLSVQRRWAVVGAVDPAKNGAGGGRLAETRFRFQRQIDIEREQFVVKILPFHENL